MKAYSHPKKTAFILILDLGSRAAGTLFGANASSLPVFVCLSGDLMCEGQTQHGCVYT